MTDPARRAALDGTVFEPRPSASGGQDPRWGDSRRRRERKAAVHGDHQSAGTAQGSTDRPRPRSCLGAVRPEAAGPAPCVRDRTLCGLDHGVSDRKARRSSDVPGWRRGRYRCARVYMADELQHWTPVSVKRYEGLPPSPTCSVMTDNIPLPCHCAWRRYRACGMWH
jgi:hypothetical protein